MRHEAGLWGFDLVEVAALVDRVGGRDEGSVEGSVDGGVGCDEDAGRPLAASAVAGDFAGVELEMVLRVR